MRKLSLSLLLAAIVGLCIITEPSRTVAGDDAKWGSITGQLVYKGDAPVMEPVTVAVDPKHCNGDRGDRGPILNQQWVVNKKNNGVKNVFIWLGPDVDTKGAKFAPEQIHPLASKAPAKDAIIDQPCCEFEPHAVAVQSGQKLLVKNTSPVAHNVQWNSSKNGSGNLSLPAKTGVNEFNQLIGDRTPLMINCNVHPWMNAIVRVYDHGYFAVTDADGKFEIKNAPVGKVRLFVWHEGLGYLGGKAGASGKPIELKGTITDLGKLEISK